MTRPLSSLLSLVPVSAVSACFVALAWREQGSTLASDWLAYALGAGLLVATVVASGVAFRPQRPCLLGLGGFAALAVWTALSASWSPVPALARDEAMLVLFYALALAVPLLTLRSEGDRLGAIAIVVGASAALVVATSVRLVTDDGLADLYWEGRLATPIGYPGAEAAIFLVAFWPAAALAACRRLPLAGRTLAFGATVTLLAGWLMTQARAGAVALALSAIVVLLVTRGRLRLLVPAALATVLVAPAYGELTEPFRIGDAQLEDAIQNAGTWALVLSVAGVVAGAIYALADRRLTVPPRVARAAGAAVLAAAAITVAVGLGGFLVASDNPGSYLGDRWDEFKRKPERETGSSHLVTIGSNRYDLWRVAANEFREHPLAGAGARAFGPAYLRHGRTEETPQRGHSLELDLLAETGLAGLVLLAVALLPFAWLLVRRARSSLVAAGVLGGVAYWLVHASGDWIWTFPAAGLPFFLLLGAGSAGGDAAAPDRRIGSRAALPAGLAAAAAALLLFMPPWLSSRYTGRALEQTSSEAADELRWARRLDPLSIDPLVAEANLAGGPREAIPALEEAVERQPRTMTPHYLLGLAYREAGRPSDARRELEEAVELAPRSGAAREALRSVR